MKLKIGIILVVYNRKFNDIPILKRLKDGELNLDNCELFIYDNSPESLISSDDLVGKIEYYHDKLNSGLAVAYNWGLKKCEDKFCNWLLLLDHDTLVGPEYLMILEDELLNVSSNVVAIVPKIYSGQRQISPVYSSLLNYHKPFLMDGDYTGSITGINSCTLLRVSYIKYLNGFNTQYPLDYLDHWYFDTIKYNKKYIRIVDFKVDQDLSIDDFDNKVSLFRFNSILEAKSKYYKTRGLLFQIRFFGSLILSLIKMTSLKKDREFISLIKLQLSKFLKISLI